MGSKKELVSKEQPLTLLKSINEEANKVIQGDPNICDRLGYPGHYRGIYDQQKTRGNMLTTDNGEEVFDATNFWMTLPVNINKWFDNEPDLVHEIGMSALRASTISELATPQQALFLDMGRVGITTFISSGYL